MKALACPSTPAWLTSVMAARGAGVTAEWRRRDMGLVNLANNELHHPRLSELIREAAGTLSSRDWHAYPDYARACSAFSDLLSIPAEQVLFTAGSDHAYKAILDAFAEPGTVLISQVPNYSQLFVYAALLRVDLWPVPFAGPVGFDLAFLLDRVGTAPPGSIVTVSNPNGPTGQWWNRDEIRQLLRRAEERRCLVVIDEAYSDFAPESLLTECLRWSHAVVLRSTSKGLGLAGGRLAVCVSSTPDVAQHLQRWNVTNPVSGPTLRIAEFLLARPRVLEEVYAEVRSAKSRLGTAVASLLSLEAAAGEGNFVVFRADSRDVAARRVDAFAGEGFAVRHLARFGLPDYFRISVRDHETTGRVIAAARRLAAAGGRPYGGRDEHPR
jgi:histidinol-phosphate aminotransferase